MIWSTSLMSNFIGREAEFLQLKRFLRKKTASLLVVNGRRRVGKSRLIAEFGRLFNHYFAFSGLAPTEGITAVHQREEICRKMSEQFDVPKVMYDDWGDIFWAMAKQIPQERTLLLLDEISWMGMDDETFLSKLKNAWDDHFKLNNKLIVVICGSASNWIEENILSSTGFVGRISHTLTLEPLPLSTCTKFWPKNISRHEILKVLSVTGGIPKYLEEIEPQVNAEENIKNLCFTQGGLLVNEFKQIFSNLFKRDSEQYKKILKSLCDGTKTHAQISKALNVEPTGRMSEYLNELKLAGFIKRDYTWHLRSGDSSKLSKWRLSDNYIRFYLKYIEKNLDKIERGAYQFTSLNTQPGWGSIQGLQFENLILNNRPLIHHALNINPTDILTENPYFQTKTKDQTGCQVDYMIQTNFNTLYICEIRFTKKIITTAIIEELENKINALSRPKYFSIRPVLIHAGEVSDAIVQADYFTKIIDITSLF